MRGDGCEKVEKMPIWKSGGCDKAMVNLMEKAKVIHAQPLKI